MVFLETLNKRLADMNRGEWEIGGSPRGNWTEEKEERERRRNREVINGDG